MARRLTLQQVFNKAVAGIAAQGWVRALITPGAVGCAYRAGRRRAAKKRCAIGHNIPDETYEPGMDRDGLSVGCLIREYPKVAALLPENSLDQLTRLQTAHDSAATKEVMQTALLDFGRGAGLTIPKVLRITPA